MDFGAERYVEVKYGIDSDDSELEHAVTHAIPMGGAHPDYKPTGP